MRGQRINTTPMGPTVEAEARCVVSAMRMIERKEPVTVQAVAKAAHVQVSFAQAVIDDYEHGRGHYKETDIRGKILRALDEALTVAV